VIAVAGSNGKTTTKELIAHLLSQKYKVLRTIENYNNQIGVPLTILQLDNDYETAVIEIGTNEPGEIAILSEMLEPTAGIITNIGEEHLEKLIDLDGVELEETYLFGYLMKKGGTVFLNIDDQRLNRYSILIEKKITFGLNENADVRGAIQLDRELHPELLIKKNDRTINANMQLSGIVYGLNALAATAIAIEFGLNDTQIINALSTFKTIDSHSYGRMAFEKINNAVIINDCYNANPPSMRAALSALKHYPAERKRIAILGDMLELGDYNIKAHTEVLSLAIQSADFIFLFGNEMKKAADIIGHKDIIKHYSNKIDIIANIKEYISEGDVILVKGSRGMKMEEIIIEIKNHFS
jgi:UDP-N-acetylmuramoyl-tripeptide--D-alanyl-D-alanine ligase